MKVLLASGNRGKLAELRELFQGTGIELLLPADAGIAVPQAEENGASYAENALIKATSLIKASGMPALADDSGLEVDSLDGAPGIHSARFSGPNAADGDNNRKLLSELGGNPVRSARFRCVLVLANPDGSSFSAEGLLEGEIGKEPRGTNGFGYDPVFRLPDGRHVAELHPREKASISHRARAAKTLAEILRKSGTIRPAV